MSDTQQTGRVIRSLPGPRVVVLLTGGTREVTASAAGLSPRPGSRVLILNPGRGWVVVAWQ